MRYFHRRYTLSWCFNSTSYIQIKVCLWYPYSPCTGRVVPSPYRSRRLQWISSKTVQMQFRGSLSVHEVCETCVKEKVINSWYIPLQKKSLSFPACFGISYYSGSLFGGAHDVYLISRHITRFEVGDVRSHRSCMFTRSWLFVVSVCKALESLHSPRSLYVRTVGICYGSPSTLRFSH